MHKADKPMNEKEKYLSLYQGELAAVYQRRDERGHADGGYGRACWGEGMLKFLRQWKVKSLLDVGCGYGRFCDAASRFVPQVMGLDIASVASGQVIDNPKITFFDGEAKQLPLPERGVEWITAFDCIEHCPESQIDAVLAEFDRVCANGFILSISFDPDHVAGVPLHLTVRPEAWWLEKLRRCGMVTKLGRVPITGAPYYVCRKPVAKRLICYCAGGIGNRLLPLASCAAWARLTGRELALVWRDDDFRCQAGFNELFENPISLIQEEELLSLSSYKIYADSRNIDHEAELNRTHRLQTLARRQGCHSLNTLEIDDTAQDLIIFHNGVLDAADKVSPRQFFEELTPIAAIRAVVEKFAAQHTVDQHVMGVHARGTDFNVSVTPYAQKIEQVLRDHPQQRFLVCSDDPTYEAQLAQRFAQNVLVRPKQDHVRRADSNGAWINNTLTSKAAAREAVVDLYLLARTNFKIYHAGSSFALLVNFIQQAQKQPAIAPAPPVPPRHMPEALRAAYTMNGRIEVKDWYLDESRRDGNLFYSKELLARLLLLAQKRQSCNYGDTDQWLYQMLERYPIAGQRVLVMGSQVPFYEAVCLAQGAYPTTVEFSKIRSESDALATLTVDELARCQEQYDAAISISTFEHTGLGRYGDPLDPDGDLKAMMMMRTKIKHGGLLFLSVPMRRDVIVWNAHRIYGHTRFPHLVAGWDLLSSIGSHADSATYRDQDYFQPIHVLRNNTEPHIEILVELFKRHPNTVFIETGTALGRGVKAALKAGFAKIYSIEENQALYDYNQAQFASNEAVTILHGQSLTVLPQILSNLQTPVTFWLDAHRTGGGLDGGGTPYPLLSELGLLQGHPIRRHTLLIDDRRLFETEFGIREEQVRQAIAAIDPQYCFETAHSTPAKVAYGQNDILVAVPPLVKPHEDDPHGAAARRHPSCAPRIFYFCPDVAVASAGVRRLYRHVAALVSHGLNAAILHQRLSFKAPDQPDVPLDCLEQTQIESQDVVVIPEGHPQIMERLGQTASRKFVIALNWDYVFKTLPNGLDWRHFNIERVMVVSAFIGQMISWAMRLPIHLLDSAIDHERYHFSPEIKQRQVVYIQRKAACIAPLLRLLAARNARYTGDIQWRALTGLSETDYAREIRAASLFLNLSAAEGFPTSCMEAMAAGTVVAGFDGVGGRELLKHGENCLLAPTGDYVSLAYTLAPLLDNMLNGGTAAWGPLRENGFKTAAPLTLERETRSLLDFWQSVL
jgi:SAM-dependent methyltransferase